MFLIEPLLSRSLESNIVNAVRILVKHLKVKVSTTSIKKKLLEHPDYPSLLSVSDSLASWKIPSLSFKAKRSQLNNFSTPFLVQIKEKNGTYFSVVSAMDDTKITLSDSMYNRHYEIGWDDFLVKWTNIVTVVESSVDSYDDKYLENRKSEKLRNISYYSGLGIIFTCFLFTTVLGIHNFGISALTGIGILITKLVGVYIGALLLWYEIDKNNLTIQKVCRAGKRKNCSAVLQSPVSKLFGIISWSELGFVYFLGGFLFLLSEVLSPSAISLSLLFSLLSFPYVVFSVIYQWKVVRQWCVLCLAVQFILFIDMIIGLFSGAYTYELISNISFILILKAVGFYVGLLISWVLLKPVFINSRESIKNKIELTKLRHNMQIYEAQLVKQRMVINDSNDLGFIFGNTNATHKLIKVCNPYCAPCANIHPEIHQLMEAIPELAVQIIFTASSKDDDSRSKPVKHFYAILEQYGPVYFEKSLDDWYMSKNKDYDSFAEKYPVEIPLNKYDSKLDEMSKWCKINNISYTPTIYINGYELPDMYSVGDLRYFIA